MSDFTLDTAKLKRAMEKTPEAAANGAKIALGDIKRDWVRESRDIAPIDPDVGGNLRRQIQGEVYDPGANGYVEVEGNATSETGGKRFNYGYYIHEKDAGGKQLRTPGTVKEFLDESAENRESDWQKWLEEEMENALKGAGW